jgi:membrane-associated protease RseP (regulator of RpoE activity)
VFFAKKFRMTKGKSRDRKKYPDRPEKADDLRIEAEWRNGYLNQNRGQSYCYIALDSIRSLDLNYLPSPRERFPKAPEGRNWNVNILAGSRFSFFFALEDSARAFINAVASVLAQRDLELEFSRFGLMWDNLTHAQSVDMGRSDSGGVLVTQVAVGGPADRAGVRPLDAILEVNGVPVTNFSHFSLLLDGIAPGTNARILLLRRLKDPHAFPEPSAWETMTVEMEAR